MDVGSLAAQACGAGVVVPAQAEIVHPPDLRCGCDSDIDANGVKVCEAEVKIHRGKCTVVESWTSWNGDTLRGYGSSIASGTIKTETRELEVTGRALGVAAERCAIYIKAETTSEAMITIADVSRVAIFESVGSRHGVRAVDVEVGNELCEERLGGW